MNAVRPIGCKPQCHNCSHGKAASDDHIAVLAQFFVSREDAGVPVLPARSPEIVGTTAVARELRAGDGVPGSGQPNRDEAHLDRRAAEAMNEENAGSIAGKVQATINDAHDFLLSFSTFAGLGSWSVTTELTRSLARHCSGDDFGENVC